MSLSTALLPNTAHHPNPPNTTCDTFYHKMQCFNSNLQPNRCLGNLIAQKTNFVCYKKIGFPQDMVWKCFMWCHTNHPEIHCKYICVKPLTQTNIRRLNETPETLRTFWLSHLIVFRFTTSFHFSVSNNLVIFLVFTLTPHLFECFFFLYTFLCLFQCYQPFILSICRPLQACFQSIKAHSPRQQRNPSREGW